MLDRYPGPWRIAVLAVFGACAWVMLSPLLLVLPVFQDSVGASGNAFQAGRLPESLVVVLPAALAGLVGAGGTALVARGNGTGKILIGGAALTLLLLTVFAAGTIGKVFFPSGIVLAFAALWLSSPSP